MRSTGTETACMAFPLPLFPSSLECPLPKPHGPLALGSGPRASGPGPLPVTPLRLGPAPASSLTSRPLLPPIAPRAPPRPAGPARVLARRPGTRCARSADRDPRRPDSDPSDPASRRCSARPRPLEGPDKTRAGFCRPAAPWAWAPLAVAARSRGRERTRTTPPPAAGSGSPSAPGSARDDHGRHLAPLAGGPAGTRPMPPPLHPRF
jgi:hypothetical protein